MTENDNGHTNGNVKGHAEEPNLDALESPTKPWYLSTKALARVVHKSVAALENSNIPAFEQSLSGLDNVINVVQRKTSNSDLVINLESTHDLIEELDTIRSDQFNIRSDGLDNLRGKLASTVKKLIACVVEQKQMAADFLSNRANGFTTSSRSDSFDLPRPSRTPHSTPLTTPSITPHDTPHVTPPITPLITPRDVVETEGMNAASLYQRTMAYLQPVLEQVKQRYPQAFEKLATAALQLQEAAETKRVQLLSTVNAYKSSYGSLLQNADTHVVIKTIQALQTAQPYANRAYTATAPVFNAALERALPYLQPLLARIHEARAALESNATVGPYVKQTLQRLHVALELAKLYCTIGDPGVAVAAGLTGVPPAHPPPPPPHYHSHSHSAPGAAPRTSAATTTATTNTAATAAAPPSSTSAQPMPPSAMKAGTVCRSTNGVGANTRNSASSSASSSVNVKEGGVPRAPPPPLSPVARRAAPPSQGQSQPPSQPQPHSQAKAASSVPPPMT